MADLDVEKLRADTPAVDRLIHLDNAGAALMPDPVVSAVLETIRLEASVGGYVAAETLQPQLNATYERIATLIGARSEEIALFDSATTAWNAAFQAIVRTCEPGSRVITGPGEYVSNYISFVQAAKRAGLIIDVAPADESGQIDVVALERMIGPRTRLIAITHVPANDGLINPAAAIGRIARKHDLWYLLDACQSVGQLAIDVREIGCDFMSATGRKFLRAPRGTGFLYVRSNHLDALEPWLIDLHGASYSPDAGYVLSPHARRFETFERSVANQIGLGVAAAYAQSVGMNEIEKRVRALAAALRDALAALPGCTVHDRGSERGAIVTASFAGASSRELRARLRQHAVNVHLAGPNESTPEYRPTPDAVRLRLSPHYYNTLEEIHEAVRILELETAAALP